ncbi:MAG: LL-diaminopimelate aminotransferase [Edafosvirus sp.]|uniref:LL-diaminopimelate aminotransferase n=1 Tax=Edafosvirus sp. TaxID=2487765 RepID=A0A3G4ZS27_9VIRU|nr:MAG: LL-diaminopimelate aminotransferase [Edafosvirus sp.]
MSSQEFIYMTTNTGQLFTELYSKYSLLNPPLLNVVEQSTYLRSSQGENPELAPNFAKRAEEILTTYFKQEGTLDLYIDPNKDRNLQSFYPCTGGTQLFAGIVCAIVTFEPNKKFVFVQKIPYFNLHRVAVTNFNYPNARYQGFYDVSEVTSQLQPGEEIVEYVTSVNNPDGTFRKPSTDANILIVDFVFGSPFYGPKGDGYLKENLKWMREARKQGKHIFSFDSASKHFGKAGDRWGYMWYPMYDEYAKNIYQHFVDYTIVAGGVSCVSGSMFLDLVTSLLNISDINRKSLYKDFNRTIKKRYHLISKEIKKRYKGSTVATVKGSPTFYVQINDSRLSQKPAADIILADTNTFVNNGTVYGSNDTYIRVNLTGTSFDFVEFLNRLAGRYIYNESDVFISSVNICSQVSVNCEVVKGENNYIVNPNDCDINVYTNMSPFTIVLPKFINYEFSKVITIRKFNDNYVKIQSDDFSINLDKKIKVRWVNPFFKGGSWIIVKKKKKRTTTK